MFRFGRDNSAETKKQRKKIKELLNHNKAFFAGKLKKVLYKFLLNSYIL
jgi:hypothetical protein